MKSWRLAILVAFALFLLLPTSVAAAECEFVLGFKTLRDLIGHDIVGECLENQHHGANGDGLQQTTGGLLVWRKADNFTAFTDGYRSWINGPYGLVQRLNTERFEWEADYAPGGGIATPTPTPTPIQTPEPTPSPMPTLSPESIRRIEQAMAPFTWAQKSPWLVNAFMQLAQVSQPVFWTLLHQVGENAWSDLMVNEVRNLAEIDEATALRIVRKSFMGTAGDVNDLVILKQATRLASSNLAGLHRILSHPRLRGDITEDNLATFMLLVLKLEDPEAARMLEVLPWVRDGIERNPTPGVSYIGSDPVLREQELVVRLVELALQSRQTFVATLGKSWLQDGLNAWETNGLDFYLQIAELDAISGLRVIEMPFLDSVERYEAGYTLYYLLELAYLGKLSEFLSHPAFAGAITDDHEMAVALLSLEVQEPETAAMIRALPWVRDGISEDEKLYIHFFKNRAEFFSDRQVFQALLRKGWVRDGLSDTEKDAFSYLSKISPRNDPERRGIALRIIDMPFLDSFDGIDSAASFALFKMSRNSDRNYLRRALSHPTLRDGITHEDAKIIAGMSPVVVHRPEQLFAFLNPRRVSLRERVIELPQGREVELTVVNLGQAKSRTLDLLDFAVRTQQRFVGVPFPDEFIVVVIGDVTGDAAGLQGFNVIAINSRHDRDVIVIAHEVAHFYWSFAPLWLREGAAELMAAVTKSAQTGAPLRSHRDVSCRLADNISYVESYETKLLVDNVAGDDVKYEYLRDCEYGLGLGMFLDLYRSLGDEAFRQSFRRLYLKLEHEEHIEECRGKEAGVCYMKYAFVYDAGQKSSAIADRIINRWYHGSESVAP